MLQGANFSICDIFLTVKAVDYQCISDTYFFVNNILPLNI